MKRSEMMAWTGLVGLLAIGLVLLAGGVMYNTTTFWAGTLLALSQALVCGLAGWGLALARQRAELQELPEVRANEGFRMSLGNETDAARGNGSKSRSDETEIKTLDTGFQRMLVGITAVALLASSAWIIWMIYYTFQWAKANLDRPFPIAGRLDKPVVLNELGLLIGLAAAVAYVVLQRITRPRRREAVYGDAVASNFTLGVAGMVAVGIATVGGYFKIAYAAEFGGAVVAALLGLQGVEVLVNAFRSYSAVEETDEAAIDLQALPLVPMLGSVWLNGIKMLFAQSFGLSRRSESGVIARMMPRAIAALVVLTILISCVRVVRPGEVAILERLGYAKIQTNAKGEKELDKSAVLQQGLHLTLPWPIDTLVRIPTEQLQTTNVGAELHAPDRSATGGLDFQFWTVRLTNVSEEEDSEDQFITGDPAPQILETYVVVSWRVKDPSKFYTGLSHSEFIYGKEGKKEAMPIYEALVKECTGFAVTRTFAIHTLDEIMTYGRTEVEGHCKEILQDKLKAANSGIEIVDLTIKDLHPPFGKGLQPDPSDPTYPFKHAPAHAYEFVTAMRERKETLKNEAEAYKISQINLANGDAAKTINTAKGYMADVVARAQGEAARLTTTLGTPSSNPRDNAFRLQLAEQQAMFRTLKKSLDPVSKVVLDPKVPDITMYQTSEKAAAMLIPRPPG